MKSAFDCFRLGVAAVALVTVTVCSATGQTNETIALIEMNNVPLSIAIREFARQMELNYIVAPQAQGPTDPLVSIRFTNVTAEHALITVLADHQLVVITNLATTVARITVAGAPVKAVPASLLGVDTNSPIPIVRVDDAPVLEAITNLAAQAHLKITVDSKVITRLDPWSRDSPLPRGSRWLSFQWKGITSRQALLAVLDNYDLVPRQNEDDSSWQISLGLPNDSEPDGAANGSQPIRSETNSTSSAAGSRR